MLALVTLLGGWRATAFAALAALALAACGVQTLRMDHAKTVLAKRVAAEEKAAADAQIVARKREYESAVDNAKIAQDYEKAKQNAQAAADKTIADLRAGTVRLRDRWNGCEATRVSETAATAGELDAAARDREESASRIIAAAAECDSQVKALQDIITADRK